MATRKPEAGSPAGTRSRPASDGERLRAVPRAWLVAVTVLLVVPWLVAGAIYFGAGARSAASTNVPASSASNAPSGEPSRRAAPGPWGDLTITAIVVSPPLEYVSPDWGGRPAGPGRWFFPGVTLDLVESYLISIGMPQDVIARVLAASRPAPDIGGIVTTPDPEIIRSLSPDVRSRLYMQLAKSRLNFNQVHSFRFLGSSPDDWLAGSLVSSETRRLIEPLIYRDGNVMHFADVGYIQSLLPDVTEQRKLAKALLRQATMLVRLEVDSEENVDRLAEYWGRGGRRTDLKPLLESVAGARGDRSIDIVHLLPALARDHMYRYPRLTAADMNKSVLVNCLWSALNFFRSEPEERFADIDVATATLKRDYFIVESDFLLGDIVAFLDADGILFHVAVYLADDLVFTKNGMSPMAPWVVSTIDDVKAYYRPRSAEPRILFHRRNDL